LLISVSPVVCIVGKSAVAALSARVDGASDGQVCRPKFWREALFKRLNSLPFADSRAVPDEQLRFNKG
jgi:hypothetical protein